jgi:serine protease Do
VLLFAIGILVGGVAWSIWGRPEGRPTGGNAPQADPDTAVVADTASNDAGAASGATGVSGASDALARSRRTAVVEAAEKIGPAVVSISVVQTRYVRGRARADPFGFFDRYLPGPIYRERIPSLGSGFIIDRAGIVLTNEHVVHDAEQIKVTLTDGRNFDARLIGSDPNYDLAVLKIDGEDLPTAALGDSEDIMIGEWVIALGNPFGFLLNDYQPSVTVGVVSAKGRDVTLSESTSGIYKDMIQTDAAINPGNSGGPLANVEG